MNTQAFDPSLIDRDGDNPYQYFFDEASPFQNCLDPLLAALGWLGDKRQIVETFPHFAKRLERQDYLDIMHELNYEVDRFRFDFNDIDARFAPCLYVSDCGRVYVLLGEEGDKLRVHDGQRDSEQLVEREHLQGEVFIFKEQHSDELAPKPRNWVLSILWQYKPLFYRVLLISLLLNIFTMCVPLYIMVVYDRVVSSESYSMLAELTTGIVITVIGLFALTNMRAKLLSVLGARLDTIIGNKIFERLIYLPSRFSENATVGAQVSRIKDFDTVREFFTSPLFTLLTEVPFIFLFLAVIGYFGGMIALIPIAMIGVFTILSMSMKRLSHKYVIESARATTKRQEFLIEALNHLRMIKCFSAEHIWRDRFKELSSHAAMSNYKSALIANISTNLSDAFVIITGLCMLAGGVMLAIAGDISVGALIAIMMLTWRTLSPIKSLFENLPRFEQLMTSIGQINALMGLKTERDRSQRHALLPKFKGRITFNSVSFRYDKNMEPAMLGVSFNIKPGQFVMVSGRNGAGKSTLLKMILRIYQQQSGTINIDGMDTRQIDFADIRHMIGYVPQNSHFFYGTINQNIRLSHLLATEPEIVQVTQELGIFDEIMNLEDGFETRLKDRGQFKLSAALQQMLSIVQALVKKPAILLLDEPLKNLDQPGQECVLRILKKMSGKTTILMIEHNFSHYKWADRILYLNDGQLIFDGTPKQGHEQLKRLRR